MFRRGLSLWGQIPGNRSQDGRTNLSILLADFPDYCVRKPRRTSVRLRFLQDVFFTAALEKISYAICIVYFVTAPKREQEGKALFIFPVAPDDEIRRFNKGKSVPVRPLQNPALIRLFPVKLPLRVP